MLTKATAVAKLSKPKKAKKVKGAGTLPALSVLSTPPVAAQPTKKLRVCFDGELLSEGAGAAPV